MTGAGIWALVGEQPGVSVGTEPMCVYVQVRLPVCGPCLLCVGGVVTDSTGTTLGLFGGSARDVPPPQAVRFLPLRLWAV